MIVDISIHSPRMGRDLGHTHADCSTVPISIHSPRMGRDFHPFQPNITNLHFNPLSPHGERRENVNFWIIRTDFNPLSPHGERRLCST